MQGPSVDTGLIPNKGRKASISALIAAVRKHYENPDGADGIVYECTTRRP